MKKITKTYYFADADDLKDFKLWLLCHDLTIKSYAKSIKMPYATIYNIMNGIRHITPKQKAKIQSGGYKFK